MTSKKESQFTTLNTFGTSDLVTGLSSGTNYNFSYTALFDAFSGMGSFNQVGDPLGAPILEQPVSGVNNIRNIESNKGVIASISPENGVMLGCNFTQTGTGLDLITDTSEDIYNFKKLQAGSNISLTDNDNYIQINFDPTSAAASKTVIISQESDFPTAVSGVITLESDTDYLLVNDITTANRFVVGNPTSIRGASSQMISLTYTGVDAMFTGTDPSFKVINITVGAPSGTVLDMNSAGFGIFQMVESNISSSDNIGSVNGSFITRFTNVAFEDVKTNGLSFTGANNTLVVDTMIAFLDGGTLFDFGTSTFKTISISGVIITESAVATTFLSGDVDSGNVEVGGLGSIFDNKVFGNAASLSGISVDDTRWNFLLNNTIPDTRPDALIDVQGNTDETVIAATDTPVLADAVWESFRESQYTNTTGGRVTYNGEKATVAPVTLSFSLLAASGGDKQFSAYIALNGSVVPQTKVQITVSSSKASSGTCIWQFELEQGDYVEAFVENNSDTVDIILTDAVLRVN